MGPQTSNAPGTSTAPSGTNSPSRSVYPQSTSKMQVCSRQEVQSTSQHDLLRQINHGNETIRRLEEDIQATRRDRAEGSDALHEREQAVSRSRANYLQNLHRKIDALQAAYKDGHHVLDPETRHVHSNIIQVLQGLQITTSSAPDTGECRQIDDIQEELENTKRDLAQAQEAAIRWEAQVDEVERRLEDADMALSLEKTNCSAVGTENQRLQFINAQYSELEETNVALDRQLQEMTSENESLRHQKRTLENEVTTLKVSVATNARMSIEKDEMQQLVSDLKTRLEEAPSHSHVETLTEQIQTLQRKVRDITTKVVEESTLRESSEKQLADLKSSFEALESARSSEVDELRRELTKAQDQIQDLSIIEQDMQDVQANLTTAQKRNETLSEQLQDRESILEARLFDIETLEQNYRNARSLLKEQKAEETLRAEQNSVEIALVKQELERVASSLSMHENAAARRDNECERHTRSVEALNAELQACHTLIRTQEEGSRERIVATRERIILERQNLTMGNLSTTEAHDGSVCRELDSIDEPTQVLALEARISKLDRLRTTEIDSANDLCSLRGEELARYHELLSYGRSTYVKLASSKKITFRDLECYGISAVHAHEEPPASGTRCAAMTVDATCYTTQTEVLRDLLEFAYWQSMGVLHKAGIIRLWHHVECVYGLQSDLRQPTSIISSAKQVLGRFNGKDLTHDELVLCELLSLRFGGYSIADGSYEDRLSINAIILKGQQRVHLTIVPLDNDVLVLITLEGDTILPFMVEQQCLKLFLKKQTPFIDIKVNGTRVVLNIRGAPYKEARPWFQKRGLIVKGPHDIPGVLESEWDGV